MRTLIAPDDPVALADAIVGYLTGSRRRRQVADRGAAMVRARFGMNTMLHRLQAVYNDMLERDEGSVTAPARRGRRRAV